MVMKRLVPVLLGGLAVLCAGPTFAQTPTAEPAATDAVVVRAANRNRLLNYVKAASAFSPDNQVARRSGDLCPLVVGARPEVNTYVTSRLRQVGQQVGVQFERKACQPNLLVLFSNEPETMLQKAQAQKKISLNRVRPTEARRFMADGQPVRWLNGVAIVPAVGKTASANSLVANGVESRLSNPTRSVVRGSVIVVDANKTSDVEVAALADYVALTALTNIKPDANLSGHRSILNLFAEGGRSADRLTPLDIAYLHGVYKARDTAYGMNQAGKIATVMAEELER
jgi:hypothetical protein